MFPCNIVFGTENLGKQEAQLSHSLRICLAVSTESSKRPTHFDAVGRNICGNMLPLRENAHNLVVCTPKATKLKT